MSKRDPRGAEGNIYNERSLFIVPAPRVFNLSSPAQKYFGNMAELAFAIWHRIIGGS